MAGKPSPFDSNAPDPFSYIPEKKSSAFWLTPDTIPDRCLTYPSNGAGQTELKFLADQLALPGEQSRNYANCLGLFWPYLKPIKTDNICLKNVSPLITAPSNPRNPFNVNDAQGFCQYGMFGGHGYHAPMISQAADWFQRTLSGGTYQAPAPYSLGPFHDEPTGVYQLRSVQDTYGEGVNLVGSAKQLEVLPKLTDSMTATEYAQTLIGTQIKALPTQVSEDAWPEAKKDLLKNLTMALGVDLNEFVGKLNSNGASIQSFQPIKDFRESVYHYRIHPEPGIFNDIDLYPPLLGQIGGKLIVLVGQTTINISPLFTNINAQPIVKTGKENYTAPPGRDPRSVINQVPGVSAADWVMVLDLRGQGGSRSSEFDNQSAYEGFLDENNAIYALQNGKTLAGLLTKDLIYAIHAIKQAPKGIGARLQNLTTRVRGDGASGATVAMLAAAFDPESVKEVELVHLPASYYSTKIFSTTPPSDVILSSPDIPPTSDEAENTKADIRTMHASNISYLASIMFKMGGVDPAVGHDFGYGLPSLYGVPKRSDLITQYEDFYVNHFSHISMVPLIPGILKIANFPHLAALIAPRPLQITDPVCMSYDRVPFDEKEKAFQYTISAYKATNAIEVLNISTTANPPAYKGIIPYSSATYPGCWRVP